MKRLRVTVLLAATIGIIAYPAKQMPIYAASAASPSAGASVAQQSAAGSGTTDIDGAHAYASHCAICHGEQREGILPAFPPLLGIGRQMTNRQIVDLIHTGKGRMPAFPQLRDGELTALLHYLASSDISMPMAASGEATPGVHSSGLAKAGGGLFQQNCAFCHGRDAGGGESGPDLTRSKLVLADVKGDKISEVVRDGRPPKMPAFTLSSQEVLSLAAFIHEQVATAEAHKGSRRGVDVADLQTGNVEAGKLYFNGEGTCAKCHSATGDLAGIAKRFEGLQLEERMLYPQGRQEPGDCDSSFGTKSNGNAGL